MWKDIHWIEVHIIAAGVCKCKEVVLEGLRWKEAEVGHLNEYAVYDLHVGRERKLQQRHPHYYLQHVDHTPQVLQGWCSLFLC